jgi:pseudaminic acid cytidylyltransferase
MRVAIIPARGGSKRIPRKNIKLFDDKPIIAYSIETALRSGLFERVIVSTDDEEIAGIAETYGAEIPFMRPGELADDHAGTGAVVEHAVAWLEASGAIVEYVCTIYPTAPLLSGAYLAEGLEKLERSDAVNALSVTSMPYPIQRSFKITPNERIEMFWPEHFYTRSQDLEAAYHDAGQFCWTHRERSKAVVSEIPFSSITIPVVMPRHLVQDIDTPEDWAFAELLHKALALSQVQRRDTE